MGKTDSNSRKGKPRPERFYEMCSPLSQAAAKKGCSHKCVPTILAVCWVLRLSPPGQLIPMMRAGCFHERGGWGCRAMGPRGGKAAHWRRRHGKGQEEPEFTLQGRRSKHWLPALQTTPLPLRTQSQPQNPKGYLGGATQPSARLSTSPWHGQSGTPPC